MNDYFLYLHIMNFRKTIFIINGLLLSSLIYSCGKQIDIDPGYKNQILNFRQKRVNFLKSRIGYLNLVGLHWVQDGYSSIGSHADNDIVFPKKFPNNFGSITKTGDQINIGFNQPVMLDSTIKVAEFSFSLDQLDHVFTWESFEWFIIKRGGDYLLRLRDFENPFLEQPFKIPYFPIDNNWMIKGTYTPYSEKRKRTISNILGQQTDQESTGLIAFNYSGNNYQLETTIEDDKLSVIFMDATTGKETYQNGRTLYASNPDENGNVILDFNKAFNFPCAFNDYTTCPVPPPKNRLAMAITAGEKSFR